MKLALIAVISVVLLLVLVAAILKNNKSGGKRKGSPILGKDPLTKNEQPMYFRLAEALPNQIVLAQVSFSALLKTTDRATRNRFDRKTADFVICDKSFKVIACVELDDSSHRGREKDDSERDKLLTDAGFRVVRYKSVPNMDDVKKAFITNEIPETFTK